MSKSFSDSSSRTIYNSHKTGVTIVQEGVYLAARCIKCGGDIWYRNEWYCSEVDEKRCYNRMPLVPRAADNSRYFLENSISKLEIRRWLSKWLDVPQTHIQVQVDGK